MAILSSISKTKTFYNPKRATFMAVVFKLFIII